MAITFYKLDAAVATDREIAGPALRLYVLMLSLANINTRKVSIYIRDLAIKYRRSERTVQRWLRILCLWGLIHREDHKRKGDPRWNEKTIFTVCGNEAIRYAVQNLVEYPVEPLKTVEPWNANPDDYYIRQKVSPKKFKKL